MILNLEFKKILLVEDNPTMRKAIMDMLYMLHAQHIVETNNGIGAVAALTQDQFDIVLCDYNLGPGKNGQQVLEEARFNKLLPVGAVFIMVTAEQNQSMVLGAMDSRPDEYLIKPFNSQQLLNRLERSCARKHFFEDIARAADQGDLSSAIHYCEQRLGQDHKNMRMPLLKMRAELAVDTGDYVTARQIYLDVLEQRDLPWARQGLGIIAFLEKNHEQAIDVFQQVLNQNPMMLETYDWLAKAQEAAGENLEALDTTHSAVDLSPQAILRQKKLALLADKTENTAIAEKAYKAAIKLGRHSIHKSSSDYSGLAKVYLKTNATAEALRVVEELHQQFTDDPEAELRAAALATEAYQKMGDAALTRQAYEKMLELNRQFGNRIAKELRLEIATVCRLNEDHQASDRILDELVKSYVDDPEFMSDIKKMCATFNNSDYAKKLIQRTRQEVIEIHNQGVRLFKEGKLNDALALFEQALAKMPDNKTMLLNMAKVMIYDIKANGSTREKILRTEAAIKKTRQSGIAHDKITELQMALAKITRPQSTSHQS
jgi:DNA-binding response OmpR family regulator/Tfp pilus assembly protein PilF